MKILITSYPNEGRKLRSFLTALLKKKLIISAKVLNYAKSYTLVEGKVQKEEQKLVLLSFPESKEEALFSLIQQLHPHNNLEYSTFSPESVDTGSLKKLEELGN